MSQPTITSSDRIRELSAINADVPALLSAAGSAINALTDRSISLQPNGNVNGHRNADINGDVDMDEDGDHSQPPLDMHKEAFTKNATAYFHHIQAIMARLRRQTYALEEAGIIAADAPTLSTTSSMDQSQRQSNGQSMVGRRGPVAASSAQKPQAEEEKITNGGLGNLDVGYLNSRGNRVGLGKETELIAEARKMLKEVVHA